MKRELKNETNLLKAPYKNKMAVNQIGISTFKIKLIIILIPKKFFLNVNQNTIVFQIKKFMSIFSKLDTNTVPLYKIVNKFNYKNKLFLNNIKKLL